MSNENESEYKLRLKLTNVPENVIVSEPLPEAIDLVLKDKGEKLIDYRTRNKYKQLVIDYRNFPNIAGRTAIYGPELERLLTSHFATSTEIVMASCDTLQFFVVDKEPVRLPVVVNGRITAGAQYTISRAALSPDSVSVYAPRGVRDTLTRILTRKVQFVGMTDSLSVTLPLLTEHRGVHCEPSQVQLSVSVSPYVSKTVEVPIQGKRFPYGMKLKTFPSKAKVTFRLSLDDFRKVTARDFEICINYSQIEDNLSGKIPLHLVHHPECVHQIHIEPAEVDYLIEMDNL